MATPTAASPAYGVAGSASDRSTQPSSETIPDSNLDSATDETELASICDYICVQKCGVVIGYPTLLVWAYAANQSELGYQLEDGSPIPEPEVAFSLLFAEQVDRQQALERLLKSDATSLTPASPTSFNIHQTSRRAPHGSTLALKASENRVTRDLLEQRQFSLKVPEVPPTEDEVFCRGASAQFDQKYGELVCWEDIFDALCILRSSDIQERRVIRSPYLMWNTDDFVMGFKYYCKLIVSEQLVDSPDPADPSRPWKWTDWKSEVWHRQWLSHLSSSQKISSHGTSLALCLWWDN